MKMMISSSSSLASRPLLQTLTPFPTNKLTPFVYNHPHLQIKTNPFSIKAQTLDFSGTFFEGGLGNEDDSNNSSMAAVEEQQEPQCPPGLRQYETMAVLRPDMSEDERLSLTHKYEELVCSVTSDPPVEIFKLRHWSCSANSGLVSLVLINGLVITHSYLLLSVLQLFDEFVVLLLQLLVAGGGMYVEVFNRGVIPLAYSIKKKNKAGETNTYLDGIYLLFTYFTKPESIEVLEATLKMDDDVIRSSTFKVRKRKY
ncbi:putative ribosomal protein S6 [Helianthus anomalus]